MLETVYMCYTFLEIVFKSMQNPPPPPQMKNPPPPPQMKNESIQRMKDRLALKTTSWGALSLYNISGHSYYVLLYFSVLALCFFISFVTA